MIVYDMSEEAIVSSLKKYLDESQIAEKTERLTALDYYEGLNYHKNLSDYFDSDLLKEIPSMQQNITKKLIDARYIAYKTAPVRNADEKYIEKIEGLDDDMLQLDRLTGLVGTAGFLRRYDGEQLKSEILLDFEPFFMAGDPNPVAIAYPLWNFGNTRDKEQWFIFWSDDRTFYISKSGKVKFPDDNPGGINPYGVVPVIYSHLYPRITNSWWRTGGQDIVNANLLYNVFGTHLSSLVMYQSHGQPWASGNFDAKSLTVMINKILKLPEGGSFGFAIPGGKPQDIERAQRWVVDTVAFANHLKIKWADNTGSTSGEHQRILEVDLTEAIMGDFQRWRDFEQKRFDLDRIILETNGVKVSDEYSVNFSEPHIPKSPQEQREEWDWMVDKGYMTKKEVMKQINPDMSEEEIEERLGEAREEKQTESKTGLEGIFAE